MSTRPQKRSRGSGEGCSSSSGNQQQQGSSWHGNGNDDLSYSTSTKERVVRARNKVIEMLHKHAHDMDNDAAGVEHLIRVCEALIITNKEIWDRCNQEMKDVRINRELFGSNYVVFQTEAYAMVKVEEAEVAKAPGSGWGTLPGHRSTPTTTQQEEHRYTLSNIVGRSSSDQLSRNLNTSNTRTATTRNGWGVPVRAVAARPTGWVSMGYSSAARPVWGVAPSNNDRLVSSSLTSGWASPPGSVRPISSGAESKKKAAASNSTSPSAVASNHWLSFYAIPVKLEKMFFLDTLPEILGNIMQAKDDDVFIDYEEYFDKVLCLHDAILADFLVILKKHLEDVQVKLGEIENFAMSKAEYVARLEKIFGRDLSELNQTYQNGALKPREIFKFKASGVMNMTFNIETESELSKLEKIVEFSQL